MLTAADTAFSIAAVRAEEGSRPPAERLFEDPYAHLFAAAGEHAREGTERFLALPFFKDGIRLRTRFLDDFVREGLAAGLTQVVLPGAGFDARALRMPELAARGARVFEVDYGHLLDAKRSLLAAAGVALPPWCAHVGCDLAAPGFEDALAGELAARGFRRGAGALFVCEGFLEYLTAADVQRNLAFMAREGGAGSRVAFTLGLGHFAPETTLERVRRAGFTACEELGFDDLWRRHLPGEPHEGAPYARVAVATV